MKLRHLEVFRAVMSAGSTLGASKILLISQPAVSNLLKQFEAQLGFPLFLRSGGRLRPTREAHSLYEESEKVFAAFAMAGNLARDLRLGVAGTVRIVSNPSLGNTFLPPILTRFKRENPNAFVRFDTVSNDRVLADLVSDAADFGLTICRLPHPVIESTVLCSGQVMCVMRADHPLAEKSRIFLNDMRGQMFVSYPQDTAIGSVMRDVFIEQEERHAPSMEVRAVLTAVELVRAGYDMALVDEFTVRSISSEGLIFRPLLTERRVPLVLSMPRHATLSNLSRNFIELYLQARIDELGIRSQP
ncbi:MAG: LysR family transcriptional regulator [Rhodospirillaceae bacterium]